MTIQPTPEDVNRTDRIDATQRIGEDQKKGIGAQPFQSYMEQAPQANPLTQQAASLSPFDLAHGQTVLPAAPTIPMLLAQATQTQAALGDVANQLSTPNLKLKQAHKYLLRNKLQDANTNLRVVNEKLGTPIPAAKEEAATATGPIAKFLGFVSDGQLQLQSAVGQLNALKEKKETLTPGDFLLIQVKLNKAQQEIEYSSVLLSKVVDDIKQLMNIQL